MIDHDRVLNWPFPDIEHAFSRDDAMLYALAIGLGADPMDRRQLRFVDDTSPGCPEAFPTLAVVLGFPGSWMRDPATGIDFNRIVHGEEELVLHGALPAEGVVIARHKVVEISDKGAAKGATIVYDKTLFDKRTGEHLATVRHTTFARGDGGFSAAPSATDRTDGTVRRLPPIPERPADLTREMRTSPQQALLYRLCADRNPLHSNPDTAAAAGFDRPILHGLCTFGIAGHAIVADWCGYDARLLQSLKTRFSAPVFPGETVVVESWRAPTGVVFQARVKERDKLVLTHGVATLTASDGIHPVDRQN